MAKALIAMSGGVDSSVAAYLTMQEGYTCIGGTMTLYIPQNDPSKADQSIADSKAVADRLGIEHHIFPLGDVFEEKVIQNFIRCYECGLTPNPCIDCNRHLKFDALLKKALALGCDHVVTGHYAQISIDPDSSRYLLKKAADEAKDQTYFLYNLDQHQLSHILFPLGGLEKDQVRQIAEAQLFINAKKQDSQDICFIPDGDYLSFIEQYTGKSYTPGDFLDLQGNVVGKHRGAVGYTLGQRKGLGVAMGTPVYVCSKDMDANTVTLGPNEALYHRTLRAKDWNWVSIPELTAPIRIMAKARSRMTEQPGWVYPEESGCARVEFDEPQRAITPGQAVVLYDGDTVVGGGTITEVL